MSEPSEQSPAKSSAQLNVDNLTLNRWILPITVSALLLAVLLFLFQYNTGDSSINSPLGLALWQIWT